MRLKQWVKNLFVFLPAFFGSAANIEGNIMACIYSFLAFSLVASSVYCFNDIVDVNNDRLHEGKKHRPIAAEKLSIKQAINFGVALWFLGISLAIILVNVEVSICLACYMILMLSYSFYLKRIPFLDLVIIALSFDLRLLVGGLATNTSLSVWIVLMVFLLALFLALAKRRDEVFVFEETGKKVRDNIASFTVKSVDRWLLILTLFLFVLYVIYTLSPHVKDQYGERPTYLTSVFVAIGLLRYLYLIRARKKWGNPTSLILSDVPLLITVIGWLAAFYWVIYM